ncbi:hypothetical protein BOTBODRAFT_83151, partial [Botryobasidium botryosum FD-172 SS1]
GIDINARDEDDHTPLCVAAQRGSASAVLLLMRLGADPKLPDSFGMLALHYAAELIDHPSGEEALTALAEAGDINAKDREGHTALCMAVKDGKSLAVLLLLELGADPNLPCSKGHVPLHYVTKLIGCPAGEEAITALCKAGNANAKNSKGCTPLCIAAWGRKPAAVLLLMRLGANPSLPCNKGHVALHHVARLAEHPASDESIIALANASDVNAKDENGDTPLCRAAWGSKPAAILLLLKLG